MLRNSHRFSYKKVPAISENQQWSSLSYCILTKTHQNSGRANEVFKYNLYFFLRKVNTICRICANLMTYTLWYVQRSIAKNLESRSFDKVEQQTDSRKKFGKILQNTDTFPS